jgi:hypothetical protein
LIIGGRELRGERIVYPLVGGSFVAVDAAGVDLEQDVHAVARSSGDLGGVDDTLKTDPQATRGF